MSDEVLQFQCRASPRSYRRTILAAFGYFYAPKRWVKIIILVLLVIPIIVWLFDISDPLFWAVNCDAFILIYLSILYVIATNAYAKQKKTKRLMIWLRSMLRDKRIRKAYYFPINVILDSTGMHVNSPASNVFWPWSRCLEIQLKADGITVAVQHPGGSPLIYSFPSGAFANIEEKCHIANQMQSWRLAAKKTVVPKTFRGWLAMAWISMRTLGLLLIIAAWLLAFDAWVEYVSSPPAHHGAISMTCNPNTPSKPIGIITHKFQYPPIHPLNSQFNVSSG